MISLLFVLIGAVLGQWRPAFLRRVERLTSRALDVLLLSLLFFTSLTFGMDRDVSGSLGRLGASALLTAALTVVFSALAGWLWQLAFARTTGRASQIPVAATSVSQPRFMSTLVALSVVLGWLLGSLIDPGGAMGASRAASTLSLYGLLLVIGYDLGKERIWVKLREYGALSLTLPVAVGLASIIGAVAAALIVRLPVGLALAAGSGFGWYSMAGAMALEQAGAEVGAYVFLSNLLREIITILSAPLLSGRVSPVAGAAMGGATSMDSTLPVITRAFGPMGAVWGLVTGTTLTLVSPFLLNLFLKLPL